MQIVTRRNGETSIKLTKSECHQLKAAAELVKRIGANVPGTVIDHKDVGEVARVIGIVVKEFGPE